MVFLFSFEAYRELFRLFKFIITQKKKIQYYKLRERYGQFVSGFYMALSTFKGDAVIVFLKKDIIYRGFDLELKNIFFNTNCFFIQSEFLYQITRFYFKNQKSENFITNYHPTETLKNKNMFNFNIEKFLKFKDHNTVQSYIEKYFLKRNYVKKIIVISLKEKKYYSSYKKIFKNYVQPDYEFDSFERLHKVANYLCKNNYLVIRTGRHLKKSNFKHKLFFDYASSKKFNNFTNDLYIASIADYLLGNMTGFDHVCYLWFKKKIFFFQIRSYKFLLHFPNIYFSKMNIKKNKKKLEIYQQLEEESFLWKSQDQNDLYKEYAKNKIYVSKYSPSIIIKNINFFLNNNSKKFNNKKFYKNYLKYFSKEYKKIGRHLPVYFANYMKN
jgi:putative glycosyltransferase (TIGR04372 family)